MDAASTTATTTAPGSGTQDHDLCRIAMENSGIGLCLTEAIGGRIVEVNQALCTLLQRPQEELKGMGWQDITHPEDLATDLNLIEELKANRRQSYCQRKRFLRADGTILWGDLHMGCVRHSDGSVQLFVAQIVDVSEAVKVQAALTAKEQEYRQLAERLDLACESVGLGIYDADLASGAVFFSAGFQRNLGYEPGDWSARQEEWFTRLHPEEQLILESEYQAVQDGSQSSLEYRMRHRDGSYRWFLGHGKGIELDDAGRARRIVGICLDISERREAQQRLAISQQRLEQERAELRATLDALIEPHILLAPVRDGSGTIVDFLYHDANPAACSYNRLPREQLVGMSLLALLPAHQATGLLEHYREAMASGQPLVLDDYAYPNDLLGEERRYDIRAVRVGDLLSYSWRDVTERHRTALQLAASEQRYRLLAENATDVVLHMRDGVITWVSPSVTRVLGWQPKEWIGRLGSDFLEPEGHTSYEANLELLAQGGSIAARNRIRARDGSWHWIDTRASLFLNEQGQPDGLLAAGRLVDTEVEALEALEHKSAELARKLKTSLTASAVAHEINQPLSVILLQAQLAQSEAARIGAAAEELRQPLATLVAESERVGATIEKMRTLLRNVQTPLQPLDLSAVVSNALLYLQPLLSRHRIRLERGGTSGPILIQGDGVQLQLAIGNLLRNSVEALSETANPTKPSEPSACIRLTLERGSEEIELRLEDNGPGFGDLDLSELPLVTTKRQGTGLGLYVVQTTVANHGGSLTIGSSSLGGAEVVLRLPLPAPAAGG
ncbi:MAG: PAS domain-containing protein [Prochlorococcaceae cyanobacterium]